MNQMMQEIQTIEGTELKRLLKAFKESKTPQAIYSATATMTNRLDDYMRDKREQYEITLACKEGCYYCCHLRVEAFPPEVFRIKEHLEQTLSQEELTAVKEKIAATASRAAGKTPHQYAEERMPCPFLDKGACGIYPVRPALCRIYHSVEVDGCKRHYEQPYVSGHGATSVAGLLLSTSYMRAMHGALKDNQLDDMTYELSQSLTVAFEVPDAYDRWIRGEKIFPQLPERIPPATTP